MRLAELTKGLDVSVDNWRDMEVQGIAYDSRKVKPGYLFVAIPGFKVDGHDYISQAVANGAVAVVASKPTSLGEQVAVIQVENSRRALAQLAANFYNHPTRRLKVFGVTGTNGKTTTCHLLAAIFRRQGHKVGVIGTIGNWIGDEQLAAARTTPESLDLQRIFHQMLEAGVTHVVMEVSSHALELHRVDATSFTGAVFTNLSQDHLDFHNSLEEYLQAKGKLFEQLDASHAAAYGVANMDDKRSFQYLQQVTRVPLIAYGQDQGAAVRADDISLCADGVTFRIRHKDTSFLLSLKIPGLFTVYNATAAAAVALQEGIEPQTITTALENVPGVAGRFERVDCGQDFTVIVDYAHTPDSLENILQAARQFVKGRLITVFGCGGDRDRSKRPLMGAVAGKLSDYTVVTSDNPRSEEPEEIINDILPGIERHTKNYRVLVDRGEAIAHALHYARPGDTVIIAGKGHETYQEVKGKTLPFDDREVAREILRRLK